MSKRRLFVNLAAAAGYIGIGMLLGYSFGDHTTNTALWLGSLLLLLGAILLGMYISARTTAKAQQADDVPPSSSGGLPFEPGK